MTVAIHLLSTLLLTGLSQIFRPPPPKPSTKKALDNRDILKLVLLQLKYHSLREVQGVCSAWREVIQNSSFDEVLFRFGKVGKDPVEMTAKNITNFKSHPLFLQLGKEKPANQYHLFFDFPSKKFQLLPSTWKYTSTSGYQLSDQLLDQPAVWPPVQKYKMVYHGVAWSTNKVALPANFRFRPPRELGRDSGFGVVEATSEKGLTLRDVLDHWQGFMSSSMGHYRFNFANQVILDHSTLGMIGDDDEEKSVIIFNWGLLHEFQDVMRYTLLEALKDKDEEEKALMERSSGDA